ncbi:hypothetical protein [Ralstonia soli]|uniref:Uncharacterized protein n=1 Tax=Ralstonia soli TaxID=2953896 RepID=A0ABT1AT42_9RALS|nr:hypothetical protein [Ralstonia soli]MCO5401593.1 hypothetical protein [Ralstonia soli]
MLFLRSFLALALISNSFAAIADVIPPPLSEKEIYKRQKDNPKTFDRTDAFCSGKFAGAACTIPGTAFSGGGEGQCRTSVAPSETTIDLECVRQDDVFIDRQYPEGGFVADRELCKSGQADNGVPPASSKWGCTPLVPAAADKFCRNKAIGAACTVELTYRGQRGLYEGVCKQLSQTNYFYFRGSRAARRDVVQCEPVNETAHTYAPATWWQKLMQ